jgi:hypothetical protein
MILIIRASKPFAVLSFSGTNRSKRPARHGRDIMEMIPFIVDFK